MESIYNLIPKPPPSEKDKLKYTSTFSSTVKDDYNKNKFAHRTMGEVETKNIDPQNFLRRTKQCTDKKDVNQESTVVKQEDDGNICDQEGGETQQQSESYQKVHRKPPVPKHNEQAPVMGIKTTKNFIAQNAVDSIMAVSKKPEKKMVDTRKGDKFSVEPSGLEKVYMKKKDYGKTPEYIIHRKEELEKMQAEYDTYVSEMRRRGEMYKLSEEEIQEMLCGLKTNWEGLYRQYQTLSVITDSLPKKNRKEHLENEMKELEKDIDMLERYQTIYIAN